MLMWGNTKILKIWGFETAHLNLVFLHILIELFLFVFYLSMTAHAYFWIV